MPALRLSPAAYRRVTLLALAALAFIIVTGAAVRLTGSGLGCPDWPTCSENRIVAPVEYHAMVEFVNRTVTGLVSVLVILAVLGSLLRVPRRRDLVWLSLGMVAGVIGQIVLGGLTVLFDLKPGFVMAHFLLSMVLLATAVVLHERAGDEEAPAAGRVRISDGDLRLLGKLDVVAAGFVLFLGTVVTSSGPHGGDEKAERFDFVLRDVARLHGLAAFVFLVLVLLTLWRLWSAKAPPATLRRGEVVLAVSVAQAAIGYAQYFTGVPALLVGFHIVGAVAVWTATLRFWLSFGRAAPVRDQPSNR
ncbi:MAG: heme a synthase [Actinomycetota bacterium]|nr:heme a synthase [Actinomycetota bacterium]